MVDAMSDGCERGRGRVESDAPHIKLSLTLSVGSWLGMMQNLEMGGNQLTVLDDSIAKLPVIKEIDLSGNLLTALNPLIAQLNSLTSLNLENNQLASLPEELGYLRSISK
jgi:Leucine-rich repeat (LRR) protein